MMEEFDCLKCGVCCYFGVNPEGKIIIRDEIPIGTDGWCIHYNKKKMKCDNYENRFAICRNFERGGKYCIRTRKIVKKLERLGIKEVLNVDKT